MSLRGRVVSLPVADIDTDRIIPARFLKTVSKGGLGELLFHDWPAFPRAAARGAKILQAGPNFGCGSSREHAVWALKEFGFEAVVAPSFADIFRGNALKNGLLPIALDVQLGAEAEVDLETQLVDGRHRFEIEPFAKKLIVTGQDELGYLLTFLPQIEARDA
jgi:3-isopropylmalate/(R)-2-methylmalate dehydratase small subunit